MAAFVAAIVACGYSLFRQVERSKTYKDPVRVFRHHEPELRAYVPHLRSGSVALRSPSRGYALPQVLIDAGATNANWDGETATIMFFIGGISSNPMLVYRSQGIDTRSMDNDYPRPVYRWTRLADDWAEVMEI